MSQAHEVWFHFTKEPRYFAAVDEIRETQHGSHSPVGSPSPKEKWLEATSDLGDTRWRASNRIPHPLGKLPGSVWNLTYWECVDRIERGWAPKDNPVILLNPPEDECLPLARTP